MRASHEQIRLLEGNYRSHLKSDASDASDRKLECGLNETVICDHSNGGVRRISNFSIF